MPAKRSPIISELIRRLTGRPSKPDEDGYRIYTTAFDEIVDGNDLPRLLPQQTPDQAASFDDAVARFESAFAGERIAFAAEAGQLVRDLQGDLSAETRARSVVSFVIDHSNSMKGLGSCRRCWRCRPRWMRWAMRASPPRSLGHHHKLERRPRPRAMAAGGTAAEPGAAVRSPAYRLCRGRTGDADPAVAAVRAARRPAAREHRRRGARVGGVAAAAGAPALPPDLHDFGRRAGG
jgi:hypothetical protein